MRNSLMSRIAVAILSAATFLSLTLAPPPAFAESDRTTNVYVAPVALLIGALAVGADFKINDKWTVGPGLLYWNASILDFKFEGQGFGVRTAYYFRNPAFEDGPYMAGGLNWGSLKVTKTSSTYGSTVGEGSGAGINGLAGYHWILPSGLSFRVGVGLGISAIRKIELKDSSGTLREDYNNQLGAGFASEIDVGWVF